MKLLTGLLLILGAAFSSPAQTIQTDSWMNDMKAFIYDKPIGSLVLPGAYRGGLERLTAGTAIPERCNTQSQDTTVYGLLCRGARYLDLSVICWRDNNWYAGTYNYSVLFGMQMATGQSLESVLDDVSRFLSEKRHNGEVVIVHMTCYADSKKKNAPATSYGELDSLKKEALLALTSKKLSAFLYKEGDPLQAKVSDVLNAVQKTAKEKTGAAILLFNDTRNIPYYPGIIRTDGCHAEHVVPTTICFKKTDSLLVLNRQWNTWQAADSGCYAIRQWVLTWRSTDNKCSQQLAQKANASLEEQLDAATQTLSGVFCVAFLNRSLSQKIFRLNVGAVPAR